MKRLAIVKREASDLYRHIKRALTEVDGLLIQHRVPIDWSILEPKVTYAKSPFDYGVLTAQVFRALKGAPETGMTSSQIAEAIEAAWPESLPRPAERRDFMVRLRKRLKALRATGGLLSPHVGDGSKSRTTWIINPERWSSVDQA